MRFENITTQEQFDQWKAFAKSFDHDAESPLMPIVTIANERNQVVGHYHILSEPIIFPAFHPTIHPRELRDSVEAVASHYLLSSLGLRYPHGVVFAAIDKTTKFPRELLPKLGFEPTGHALYRKLG